MKNYLQKIKLQLGKLKSPKISYDRGGVNPTRDWRILLSITFIILCLLVLVAFYFYRQVEQRSLFSVATDSDQSEIKINTTLLKKTVDDINARQMMNYNIRNGVVSVPSDPSI